MPKIIHEEEDAEVAAEHKLALEKIEAGDCYTLVASSDEYIIVNGGDTNDGKTYLELNTQKGPVILVLDDAHIHALTQHFVLLTNGGMEYVDGDEEYEGDESKLQ